MHYVGMLAILPKDLSQRGDMLSGIIERVELRTQLPLKTYEGEGYNETMFLAENEVFALVATSSGKCLVVYEDNPTLTRDLYVYNFVPAPHYHPFYVKNKTLYEARVQILASQDKIDNMISEFKSRVAAPSGVKAERIDMEYNTILKGTLGDLTIVEMQYLAPLRLAELTFKLPLSFERVYDWAKDCNFPHVAALRAGCDYANVWQKKLGDFSLKIDNSEDGSSYIYLRVAGWCIEAICHNYPPNNWGKMTFIPLLQFIGGAGAELPKENTPDAYQKWRQFIIQYENYMSAG